MGYWSEGLDRKDMKSLLDEQAYKLILQSTVDQDPVINDLTIREAKLIFSNLGAEMDRMRRVEARMSSLMWRLKNEIGTT